MLVSDIRRAYELHLVVVLRHDLQINFLMVSLVVTIRSVVRLDFLCLLLVLGRLPGVS